MDANSTEMSSPIENSDELKDSITNGTTTDSGNTVINVRSSKEDETEDDKQRMLSDKEVRTEENSKPTVVYEESIIIPESHKDVEAYDVASEMDSGLYFSDGVRLIDYILVYKLKNRGEDDVDKANYSEDRYRKEEEFEEIRQIFQSNLIDEGLEFEVDSKLSKGLYFVKVHAPFDLLTRYAELMNLLKPMKEHDPDSDDEFTPLVDQSHLEHSVCTNYHSRTVRMKKEVSGFFNGVNSIFNVDNKLCPNRDKRFTSIYSRDKDYLFDIPENRNEFFTTGQRSYIVDYILKRKSFSSDPNDDFDFGISKLLADGVYVAAYPLHEGKYDDKKPTNPRWVLYNQWVSLWKSFKRQPLDLIREYFGVKIGLYFAWLGFYTSMLIPACIVGIICFIYSFLTMDDFQPTKEICSMKTLMCPLCDKQCSYWNLTDSCSQARTAYLVDNPSTIFFAIFMSIWAAVFLEMWKRYSAKITYRWDMNSFDELEMPPRPEYIAKVSYMRKHKKEDLSQPFEFKMSFWRQKFPLKLFSSSVVLFSVSLAIAAIVGVILYRMSIFMVISSYGGSDALITSNAKLITTATAASINLVCILVFNQIYYRIAEYITEIEMPRTQLEFDDSLTLKLFCLQFVNYYASIFYIAFFKGRFTGRPGNYNRMAGYRQEECGSGGCLMELTVQLAVIMIGKQAMNAVIEISIPKLKKYYNSWVLKKSQDESSSCEKRTRWEDDYRLAPWRPQGLFYEYLEMVLQFGFVTIFVSAFPLAPLFALLNNVLEIRLDAFKFITTIRRSISQRTNNIGIWYRILDSIGKLSVLTNACIIAFTTNVVPRIVYRYWVSEDRSLTGYMNVSLSYFNTSDFDPEYRGQNLDGVKICSYQDFRKPPWSDDKYGHTEMYWYILVARFAFVVIFENAVALIMTLIRWIIPDVPTKLKARIHRENYVTQKMILEQELLRAKGFSVPSQCVSGISHSSNCMANTSNAINI